MSFSLNAKYALLALIPIGIAFTTIAWQHTDNNDPDKNQQGQDTIPAKHHHREFRKDDLQDDKDLDRAMRKLDEALKNVEVNIDQIDWNHIQHQINASLEKANEEIKTQVDMEAIQKQVDQAMSSIDMEKIQQETDRALQHAAKNIDFKEINDEINRALKSVKVELNSDEIRMDLRNAEKADKELDDYRDLLDGLENDGLISENGDFHIVYKDGELYINDQKQPKDVADKYKKYFKQDNTTISRNNGRFNVDTD
jgi:hypothetical protein